MPFEGTNILIIVLLMEGILHQLSLVVYPIIYNGFLYVH